MPVKRTGVLATGIVTCLLAVAAFLAPSARADPGPWSPEGNDWVNQSTSRVQLPSRLYKCNDFLTASTWTNSSGIRLRLFVVTCPNESYTDMYAGKLIDNYETDPDTKRVTDGSVFGTGFDSLFYNDSTRTVTRVWAQQTDVYFMETIGNDPVTCAQENARQSQSLSAAVGGEPLDLSADRTTDAWHGALLFPSWYPVIWLIAMLIQRPRRQRGAMSVPQGVPRVPCESVDEFVSHIRYWRFIRRAAAAYCAVTAVFWGTVLASFAVGLHPQIVTSYWVMLAVAIILIVVSIIFRPTVVERANRLPGSRSARGIAGLFVRTTAQILFVVFIGAYLYSSFLWYELTPVSLEWRTGGGVGELLRHTAINLIYWSTPIGLFIELLLLVVLCYLLDTLGRRLRNRSMREAQAATQASGKRSYLFLRSFDEDKLKVHARLRVNGLIAFANLVHRERFEEVVATQLVKTSPLLAISPPTTKLAPIGAARATLNDDELEGEYQQRQIEAGKDIPAPLTPEQKRDLWKWKVRDLAESADAIIVSATPQTINEGFWYELSMIAGLPNPRIILLVAPWKKNLAKRWEGFRRAVGQLPLFYPLAAYHVPQGVHVLVHKPGAGWKGFGAERRTDWTYAECLSRAVKWLNAPFNE